MVKGETMMPVPHGVISTSEGPVDPSESVVEEAIEEAIIEADEDEAVEEYIPDSALKE
jgi:hypothetical protein